MAKNKNTEVVEAQVLYTVTGVIPVPAYDPKNTVFTHDASTAKGLTGGRPFPAEPGHVVAVTTENANVAQMLAEIFAKVYTDVKIT